VTVKWQKNRKPSP